MKKQKREKKKPTKPRVSKVENMKKTENSLVEAKPKKKRINSRTKGHTFERELVNIFKNLGFEHCKTSRYASRILDDSKVDLANIPLNVQAKMGYWNNRPKFDIIFKEMSAHLDANFPPSNPQRSFPKVLLHKLDGKADEHFGVTMMYKDWIEIYKNSLKYEQSLK